MSSAVSAAPITQAAAGAGTAADGSRVQAALVCAGVGVAGKRRHRLVAPYVGGERLTDRAVASGDGEQRRWAVGALRWASPGVQASSKSSTCPAVAASSSGSPSSAAARTGSSSRPPAAQASQSSIASW